MPAFAGMSGDWTKGSGPGRVGDALLGEAGLGGAGKLLLGGLGVAGGLGVLLAFGQKALLGGARELLFGGLRLAGIGLRVAAGEHAHRDGGRKGRDLFHGLSPLRAGARLAVREHWNTIMNAVD